MEKYNPPPFMCLIEEKTAKGSDVSIGMITICPSTGKVVWDFFEGKNMFKFFKELGLSVSFRHGNADRTRSLYILF